MSIDHGRMKDAGGTNDWLTSGRKLYFDTEGYWVARGLFTKADVEQVLGIMHALNDRKPIEGCHETIAANVPLDDPLRIYPRILYPHRVNEWLLGKLLEAKLMDVLDELFGEEALLAQSMLYFKPPGARGQALHQDNYYLKVSPGTCMAAWVALDAADQDNGGLVVVPGTNHMDIECPHEADSNESFFRDEVHLPPGAAVVPIQLQPGDVLFFNGSTIHGSYPNRSKDRFRRSFIAHYIGRSTVSTNPYIRDDLYNRHGERVIREANPDGGPCGTPFTGGAH
ncbi:phytanoyl-CoA dioxygenase family protein [Paenibacillus koleovorans]|uniref:phytanoyl-CoA dioxygenase family protein n=1 Tax=Paenibacillus koleovorans TaxID=121608 RepID=UPI0013E38373|nr:phytanoyl-CoA dioxygenase family protein [Paenibacillus koleovorans]